MNLRKLSKEKLQQLILITIFTVAGLVGLIGGLVRYEYASLSSLATHRAETLKHLDQVLASIKQAEKLQSEVDASEKVLAQKEETMASGDLYFWFINSIRSFKQNYKVEVPQFSPIDGPRSMSLLPAFPYKQASISIAGSAYYYDFGQFLRDFENQFPYMRVLNLSVEPAPAIAAGDREKLAFRMDVVTLVKPTGT